MKQYCVIFVYISYPLVPYFNAVLILQQRVTYCYNYIIWKCVYPQEPTLDLGTVSPAFGLLFLA